MSTYALGVDGGQTSTRFLMSDLSGRPVLSGLAGRWDSVRSAHGLEKCIEAWSGILAQISVHFRADEIVSVCLGVTGGVSGKQDIEEFVARDLPGSRVTVVPDMITNLRGANPSGGHGIVVIAGGGSVAWGLDRSGREAMSGGYGYMLHDSGSAFEIGRQGIIAALTAADGRKEHTSLVREIPAALGLGEIWDVRMAVYAGPDAREVVAPLSRVVAAAALSGDCAAQAIVDSAGRELAEMAASVSRRLCMQEPQVFPTGGVLAKGGPVALAFEKWLAQVCSDAVVSAPLLPPVAGALLIALDKAGAPSNQLEHYLLSAHGDALEQAHCDDIRE